MTVPVRRFVIAVVCTLGLAPAWALAAGTAHSPHSTAAKAQSAVANSPETKAALRDLWLGHIFWVRNVALATLSKDEAAAKAAEQQVVANAQAIAGAIEPFYGALAKESLFKLLAGHYGAVRAYLLATAGGDAAGQSAATQSLTANAEEIAVFLSKTNPNLSKDAVNGLLLAHGGHHIQQIQELKAKNYEAEAKTWEEMKGHIYEIADALSGALAKQFARK